MKSIVLALGIAIAACLPQKAAAQSRAFTFVALGDMPYAIPGDVVKFDRLIAAINATKPAFSIHVGDIKSGSTPCSDENFRKVLEQFGTFDQPLVYTIGDNEWTDCHRESAGRFDPLERLAKVRAMFFAKPDGSLGKTAMPVESQSRAMAERFSTFVENARFEKNGVVFATVHVVGSNNGFEAGDLKNATEFFERNRANVAWIDDTFAKAKERDAKAIVLAWQADAWDIAQREGEIPRASGFVDTIRAVERGARAFGRPVLVVYGDRHVFEIGPFLNTSRKPVPNVTALMVMGASQVHAVKVLVDPDSPGVFGFVPLIVPENRAN